MDEIKISNSMKKTKLTDIISILLIAFLKRVCYANLFLFENINKFCLIQSSISSSNVY